MFAFLTALFILVLIGLTAAVTWQFVKDWLDPYR